MTIEEMFQRENIYQIIEDTLSKYYRQIRNEETEVKVRRVHLFQRLLVYPRIGVILPLFPCRGIIREVYALFDVKNNSLKKLIAWVYITMCLITFGLFADASLWFSNKSLYNRNIMIMPSNRKIKIFYYRHEYVDSILKVGLRDNYFRNEIKFRSNPQFSFILNFIAYGDCWYREQLLHGKGLVRTSGNTYSFYLQEVLDDLKLLQLESRHMVSASEYASKVADQCAELLKEVLLRKNITCGAKINRVIGLTKAICNNSTDRIILALSHGDLQTGNIYLDNESRNLYILDWETAKDRSIWYDSATLLCSIRRKGKFADMINGRNSERIRSLVLYFDCDKNRDMDIVASILLLEELDFFLEEIADFPEDMGYEIIKRYEYEVDNIDFKSFLG